MLYPRKIKGCTERYDESPAFWQGFAAYIPTRKEKEGYDGKLIGFTSFLVCRDGILEIQIEMLPEYQNRGFGYELLSPVLRVLFTHNHSLCFRYTVIPNNAASIAMAVKLGGELQEPESDAERALLKTYIIKKV